MISADQLIRGRSYFHTAHPDRKLKFIGRLDNVLLFLHSKSFTGQNVTTFNYARKPLFNEAPVNRR
jgi:hypothetical protein